MLKSQVLINSMCICGFLSPYHVNIPLFSYSLCMSITFNTEIFNYIKFRIVWFMSSVYCI
jgi:hypothetical protein